MESLLEKYMENMLDEEREAVSVGMQTYLQDIKS